jgi:mannose-6-phosphate isomerase-like protein (cupin superfamily)
MLPKPISAELSAPVHRMQIMNKYEEKRPWGRFEKYVDNKACTVKLLFINPGEKLSLQYHKKRDEFIKIIQGGAKAVIGDKEMKAKENDEFFIPRGTKHRVEAGKKLVKILEISFGKFEEGDEVRLEDKYNRPARPAGGR